MTTIAQLARWHAPPSFDDSDLVTEGAADAWAVFSADRTYRYLLGRRWADGPSVLWLLTNPSKAGAFFPDQTVTVSAEFSRRNGFGAMIFGNLKAFIATQPSALEHALSSGVDVVGPANARCIDWALLQSIGRIVCAWGGNGSALNLDALMLRRLTARGFAPLCLGTTKDGCPRHPLRLKYSTPLVPFAATLAKVGS